MITEKQRQLLAKIKALTQQGGTTGEMQNAEAMLQRLCDQFGIRPDELDIEEKPKFFTFTWRDNDEKQLLGHIAAKVLNKSVIDGRKTNSNRKGELLLTRAQAVEITLLYQHYKPYYRTMLKQAKLAFFVRNELTAEVKDESLGESPFSEEELHTIASMMAGMQKIPTPSKPLPAGTKQLPGGY